MIPTNALEQFSDAYRGGTVIFFAGSGISYDSGLPSALDILGRTFRAALPTLDLAPDDLSKLLSIQPEVFYETLLSVNKSMDVLGLWRSLHVETQHKYGVHCHPNNVHCAIIKYSATHAIPILTTNFDTMFEEAAETHNLRAKVFLPEHDPPTPEKHYPGRPVICKLHGSIADSQATLTLPSLMTTMTQISKLNKPWLEYIFTLMKDRSLHICFVGYSGRDVDLFPQIRKISLEPATKQPFWINRFEGDYSDEASRQCCAIRIEDSYPSDVLKGLGALYTQQPPCPDLQNMLNTLSEELKSRLLFTSEAQQLIHGLLLTKSGRHKDSYALIKKLYDNKSITFPPKQYALLLLTYARLNHEVGHYETTHQVACSALAWSKNLSDNAKDIRLNTSIQARCWKSEALRMYIPVDTYFSDSRKIIYLHAAKALVSFIISAFVAGYVLRFSEENFKKLDLETQHDLIEHKIRLLSICQGALGSLSAKGSVVQGGLVPSTGLHALVLKLLVNPLVTAWDRIMERSYKYGYSAGVANALKFSTRLKRDTELVDTQDRVYNLLTWSTGIDLSLRNKADADVESGQYPEALIKYEEMIANANESGCRLNEIKGLLGIANANRAQKYSPLLSRQQLDCFDELVKDIEGRLLKEHFGYVRGQVLAAPELYSSHD